MGALIYRDEDGTEVELASVPGPGGLLDFPALMLALADGSAVSVANPLPVDPGDAWIDTVADSFTATLEGAS